MSTPEKQQLGNRWGGLWSLEYNPEERAFYANNTNDSFREHYFSLVEGRPLKPWITVGIFNTQAECKEYMDLINGIIDIIKETAE